MAEFFAKVRRPGAWAWSKAKGLWVPGVDMRLMTAAMLHEKLKEQYEAGCKQERSITNRIMSKLLHENVLANAANAQLRHRLSKVR